MDNVLTALYSRPWAILPAKLEAIADLVERHARGEKLSPEVIALYSAQNRKPQMQRNGKVAVLPVYGVLSERMNMMTEMSGGTSYEMLAKQFQALVNDSEVSAIVLDVDSPGGEAIGASALSDLIFNARGTKPIVAVANALMASAAYYVASAADEVVARVDSEIGSIGTYLIHSDRSKADAQDGITRTVIKAGKYKGEGLSVAPLSDDAREHMQSMVDENYAQFVAAVARNRGTTPEAVRSGYGQGRTHYGARAVSSRLADRVGTLDGVVSELTGSQTRVVRLAAAHPVEKVAAAEFGPGTLYAELPDGTRRVLGQLHSLTLDHPPPDPAPNDAISDESPAATADPVAVSHPGHDVPESPAPFDAGAHSPTALKAEENPVDNPTAAPGAAPTPTVSVGPTHAAVDRGAEIANLCKMARVPERTTDYILSSKSVEQVRGELLEYAQREMASAALPPRPQPVDYEDDKRSFNLGRAVNAARRNDWTKAGFEREVSNDIERRMSGYAKGDAVDGGSGNTFYFPTIRKLSDQERESRMQATSLSAGVASNGGNIVFTEYGGFIDLLRTRVVLLAMGATFLPGLQGNVAFPRQITAGTAAAQAELTGGSDISESNLTLDQVTLSPKTVMARQSYSNQLLAQGVVNVDALIRDDLAKIQARKLDVLGLHGVGSSNEPTGLYAQSGVNAVTFSGGPTFAKMVDMVTAVEAADADVAAMGYVFTPEIKGKSQQTPTFTNTGTPIWTGTVTDGQVNGYRAMASNQLSKALTSGTFSDCHGGIFGAWSELLVGEWGGMAITVDPYTLAAQDRVRIIAREFFDIGVRHGASFTKAIQLRNV